MISSFIRGLGLLSVCAGGSFASVILVPSPGVSTIQDGIDAAVDGDVVEVAEGIYTGAGNANIVFDGKTITLRGAPNAASVIDCQGSGGAFLLSGTGQPLIESFEVRNSGETAVIGPSYAVATVRASVFRNNAGYSVIGCPDVDVDQCLIEENIAETGIVVGASTVSSCVIRANTGRGIFVVESNAGPGYVVDTEISGNVAPTGAGAFIESRGDTAVFRNCTIVSNRATEFGGGIFVWDGSSVEMENTILRFNCAGIQGNDGYMADTDDLASLMFTCSAVIDAEIYLATPAHELIYVGPQVETDPLFCLPEECENAPTGTALYTLREGSPCLPANSPCGSRIGVYGLECDLDPASVPALEVRASALSVLPNPMTSRCVFRNEQLTGARGEVVEIFTSEGRLIRQLTSESEEWGWDGADLRGEQVAAGVYHARTKKSGEAVRLVVVR